MKGVQYSRLQSSEEDTNLETVIEVHFAQLKDQIKLKVASGNSKCVCITFIAFAVIFAFFAYIIFQTNIQSKSAVIHEKYNRSLEYHEHVSVKKRNITNWQDYYFTKDESKFLNCSGFVNGDKDALDLYVNNGRMKLDKERVFDLPMDCDSIKERVYGDLPQPFKPLKRPIAFVRTIFKLYELQEALFSMSYHPDNVFCYVIDSKSTDKLKNAMRTMSACFVNVVVLEKEYNLNSGGHGQDPAHFDCLEQILGRKWDHAVILQNFDLIIKSPQQLSDISESLNYTSIMGFDFGFKYRYNTKADWTPAGMKLFKNATGVPDSILHKKLNVRKSLNEVIISKVFVRSMFEKLNMQNILKQFDDNEYYGVDEMLVQTLYEN
ncbi:unnamed protein product [Caenorhabditis sp. 36 PRJEB53466]|nr:unnamed protein product [Caenorhabditis sp. 36 PRJEB53466]